MRTRFCFWAALALPWGVFAAPTTTSLTHLPLGFERNEGQFDQHIQFICRMPGLGLYLSAEEMVLALEVRERSPGSRPAGRIPADPPELATASLRLEGASHRLQPEGLDPLPGVANYLIGDRSQWHTGVTRYERVRYRDVYPGIDLVYHGGGQGLEYDFALAPGADLRRISWAYHGFDDLRVNEVGDLVLSLAGREIMERRPAAYQMIRGKQVSVHIAYQIDRDRMRVTFLAAPYDRKYPLLIDPVLQYGAFFGGSGFDGANSIAVDGAGNAYITGVTTSLDLPRVGTAFQPTYRGAYDGFVAKLNAAGNGLLYVTYLGSSGNDQGLSVAVDSSGIAYVCGVAGGVDFPTKGLLNVDNVPPNKYSGGMDVFVAALNSAGSDLVFSVLLGGSGDDDPTALVLDSNSNIYVAGYTNSTSFTGVNTGSPQPQNHGGLDAIVFKLSKTGLLAWATYFGGSGDDHANAIAFDPTFGLFIAGDSTSTDLPYTRHSGSGRDAYMAWMSTTGSVIMAYDPGGNSDQGALGVAVSSGTVYLTGFTNSVNYPVTTGAMQNQNRGGYDAFVTIIAYPFSQVSYSTFLGGKSIDEGWSIALDASRDIYVAGYTSSSDFLPGPYAQPISGSNTFVVELNLSNPNQSGITVSTAPFAAYLGALDFSNRVSLAVRAGTNDVFLAGFGDANTFAPTGLGKPGIAYGGSTSDAFVARFEYSDLRVAMNGIGPYVGTLVAGNFQVVPGADVLIPIMVNNDGPNVAVNVRVALTLPSGVNFLQCRARVPCTLTRNTVLIVYPTMGLGQELSYVVVRTAPNAFGPNVRMAPRQASSGLVFTVTVTSDTTDTQGANNTATDTLQGGGTPPYDPDKMDINFGSVQVGHSNPVNLTITARALEVDFQQDPSITSASGDPIPQFRFSMPPSTKPLGAMQSRTYQLIFSPDSAATFNGQLLIFAAGQGNVNPFPLTITLTGQGVAAPTPTISEVDNGFSAVANSPIQSASWVVIKGTNLATISGPFHCLTDSQVSQTLPTSLDGVTVTIGGKSAFVYCVSAGQVNVQAPSGLPAGQSQVVVSNNNVPSTAFNAAAQPYSPALLEWLSGGPPHYAEIVRSADGAYIGNPAAIPGTNSAKPGDTLTLWVTGLGSTTPDFPAGVQTTNTFPSLVTNPVVTLDGQAIAFLGAVLRFAGMFQVNVQLPKPLADGDHVLRLSSAGFQSPSGVMINVKN
jgi:uncharacterized protein (TIGR03437 family)